MFKESSYLYTDDKTFLASLHVLLENFQRYKSVNHKTWKDGEESAVSYMEIKLHKFIKNYATFHVGYLCSTWNKEEKFLGFLCDDVTNFIRTHILPKVELLRPSFKWQIMDLLTSREIAEIKSKKES